MRAAERREKVLYIRLIIAGRERLDRVLCYIYIHKSLSLAQSWRKDPYYYYDGYYIRSLYYRGWAARGLVVYTMAVVSFLFVEEELVALSGYKYTYIEIKIKTQSTARSDLSGLLRDRDFDNSVIKPRTRTYLYTAVASSGQVGNSYLVTTSYMVYIHSESSSYIVIWF